MHLLLKPATPRIFRNAIHSDLLTLQGIKRLAKLTFITGPRLMLSSRLSSRSATYIIMLCVPAIMLFLSMTVPTLIFPSPEQEAYYYFASTFSQDLAASYILALSVICMLVALALPAATPDRYSAIRR